ncbi:MAG: hypothetical protein U1F77_02405 [Kiritimatiellia bacterium]
MPLLPATGSRHPRRRLLVGLMYSLLFAGSATMVWPFLLMLAGASKSPVDAREFQAVPSFLRDDRVLYRKHVEGLFNESLTHLRVTYDCEAPNFEAVEPPAATDPLLPWWERFLHETDLPPNAYGIGYLEAPVSKVMPKALREWKAALAAQFDGDLDRPNRALGQIEPGAPSTRRRPLHSPPREAAGQRVWSRAGVFQEGPSLRRALFLHGRGLRQVGVPQATPHPRHRRLQPRPRHLARLLGRSPPVPSRPGRRAGADRVEDFVRVICSTPVGPRR